MKLFEIPIYALTKELLSKRVEDQIRRIRERCNTPNMTDEIMNHIIDIETFPQRVWDYNHIIGYIVISYTGTEVKIDLFEVTPPFEKYHWESKKKKFLQNTIQLGTHFYLGQMKSGEEIRIQLKSLLAEIIDDITSRGYYVDTEAFENTNNLIDYSRLLKSIK